MDDKMKVAHEVPPKGIRLKYKDHEDSNGFVKLSDLKWVFEKKSFDFMNAERIVKVWYNPSPYGYNFDELYLDGLDFSDKDVLAELYKKQEEYFKHICQNLGFDGERFLFCVIDGDICWADTYDDPQLFTHVSDSIDRHVGLNVIETEFMRDVHLLYASNLLIMD